MNTLERFSRPAWSLLISVCLLTLFAIQSVPAATEHDKRFIKGCQEVGHKFSGGRLVLTPMKVEEYDQTIFFIHNVSMDRIVLKSITTDAAPLYPTWKTKINENRWAAFATDKQGIQFACLSGGYGGGGNEVDCQSAIEVCQFPRAKFGSNNQGNFFVTSNRSKYSARNAAIRYGILLRW